MIEPCVSPSHNTAHTVFQGLIAIVRVMQEVLEHPLYRNAATEGRKFLRVMPIALSRRGEAARISRPQDVINTRTILKP